MKQGAVGPNLAWFMSGNIQTIHFMSKRGAYNISKLDKNAILKEPH